MIPFRLRAGTKDEPGANALSEQSTKKARAAQAKRDRILATKLKRLKATGLYAPKSDELTTYRKRKVSQLSKQYAEQLDPSKFMFVKLPTGKQISGTKERKAVHRLKDKAESLNYTTSRTGLFVEKKSYSRASLKFDPKHNTFAIKRTGKVKRGRNRGTVYSSIEPLVTIDTLTSSKNRIRREAEKLGPLNKGERLAFKVTQEGNEGYSHKIMNDVDALMRYLNQYQKSAQHPQGKTKHQQAVFLSYIEIVKTTPREWFTEHPARNRRKSRKVNATGRN